MKIKMALSLFLLAIIQNSFAAECSYDFNVNTYPVVSGKQYKFTTLSNTDGAGYAALKSSDGTWDGVGITKNLLQNGVAGFELKSGVLTYNLSNTEAFSQNYLIGLKGVSNVDYLMFIHYGNNSFSATIPRVLIVHIVKKTNGSDVILYNHSYSYDNQANQKTGIYLNQDTKQIGLILNNINQGYVVDMPEKLKEITFALSGGFPPFAANSSNLGKVLSQEYIFDRSQLSSGFPAGTKDICGNSL
ncbi:DUF4882 family protein [uncultured Acinetobacter sp.]|uniref:DUF4882 family protein n=1 Tax=uncultured Acinetobacter sp. TaxID=165433 RepID=UPI00258CA40A|nr:DUF4882 family protein [uncultured Acinetobacter sp.]